VHVEVEPIQVRHIEEHTSQVLVKLLATVVLAGQPSVHVLFPNKKNPLRHVMQLV